MPALSDELANKQVAFIVKGTKVTAKTIVSLLKLISKSMSSGRQSVKSLIRQGDDVRTVEYRNENLKQLAKVLKKYGIDYAVRQSPSEKDTSVVFFKYKNAEAIEKAFYEASSIILDEKERKPSILESLRKFKEKVRKKDIERSKNKTREESL